MLEKPKEESYLILKILTKIIFQLLDPRKYLLKDQTQTKVMTRKAFQALSKNRSLRTKKQAISLCIENLADYTKLYYSA